MKEHNNITNLNEYKNENLQGDFMIEEMSPAMLEAYYKNAEDNTPDLWSRIETGFDEEVKAVKTENSVDRLRKRKIKTTIAATIIITLIAVPVMIMIGRNGNKGEEAKDEAVDFEWFEDNQEDGYYGDTTESLAESVESMPEDEALDFAQGNDVVQEDTNQLTGDAQGVTDDRTLVVEGIIVEQDSRTGEVSFIVDKVYLNEYEDIHISEGDVIWITNPIAVLSVEDKSLPVEVEFSSVKADENGKYEGYINLIIDLQ